MAMKIANVAELKNSLSKYLGDVERGEEIEVRKRNIPVARIVPAFQKKTNATVLGCGRDTVAIKTDLTEPFMPVDDWNMETGAHE